MIPFVVADFHQLLTGSECAAERQVNDLAAVEDCGNLTFGTECLLLPSCQGLYGARRSVEMSSFLN